MAVRGLFTELDRTSYLHLLWLVRAHGSINKLFSIEKGTQENLVDGGAGSIAHRMAADLGDAIHLGAPVRSITQRDDHVVVVTTDDLTVTARHAVVTVPPALALEIAFDPVLPDDRLTLYRNAVAGPETKTLVVYDTPFWRADGFSGQTAEPRSAAEVTIDASPSSGARGVIASFTFGPVAERLDALEPAERRRLVLDALTARLGPKAASPDRLRRDRVVAGRVDARLLDGAPPARASSRGSARCSRSRWVACTGPAPRRRPSRTARSTARSAPVERAAAEILDRS